MAWPDGCHASCWLLQPKQLNFFLSNRRALDYKLLSKRDPRVFQQHGAFLHTDTSVIVPRTTLKFNCDTTYSLRAGPTGKQVEKGVTGYHFWKLALVVRSALPEMLVSNRVKT